MSLTTPNKLPLITLVGPPNSGKTTLFNFLSGKNFKTVNYPGSTIEYNSAQFLESYNLKANLLDSPGIISLVPNSPDEEITVNSLYNHPKFGVPNLVIVTADSSQLSRHLLLVKQLISSNFNVTIALTMTDILKKKGFAISSKLLEEKIGCKVVKVDGRSGKGTDELVSVIKSQLGNESHGKELVKIIPNVHAENILNHFKEIEIIENEVINPIADEKDLAKANASLNKLAQKLQNSPDSLTLKLDKFLLHRIWGIVFFLLITGVTFTSIFWLALPLMEFVDESFATLATVSSNYFGSNWYGDLIADGLITSVGAVLIFVPQIVILFIILGFLEDTGYLSPRSDAY